MNSPHTIPNEIVLPWPPKELSPNARSRTHWKATKAKARYKTDCYLLAKQAKARAPEAGLIRLRVDFYPPARYAYDRDNLLARMKSGFDGIAQAMGVDDVRFHPVPCYRFDEPVKNGQVIVRVEAA